MINLQLQLLLFTILNRGDGPINDKTVTRDP